MHKKIERGHAVDDGDHWSCKQHEEKDSFRF